MRALQKQVRSQDAEVFTKNPASPRIIFTFGWGLNQSTDPQLDEAIDGYNFDLAIDQKSLVPRKPFDLKGTATNSGKITGFMQLVKRDTTQTTLVCAGTTVYLWDGGSTFTSKATVTADALLRADYWSLGDYLCIADVNLNNVVAKWDGTTYSNMTTGLASALYAKYVIVHANRVWFFNITLGVTTYPHMILASKFEDPTVFDNTIRGGQSTVGGGTFTTGLEAFYILTPDLKPINGAKLFNNVLIVSTLEGRMWQLTGTNSKDFQFIDLFDTEPSIGNEGLESIGNDVVFVAKGGEIFNLNSSTKFGTVIADTLSRPIPTTTRNLSTVNAIVYDILNQKVLFFVPGQALVLFKEMIQDKKNRSPWSVYLTLDSSNFTVSHAKYMRIPGTTNYSVFFGDSKGRIFDLNGTGTQDSGAQNVNVMRKSRHIGTELIDPWPWTKENITGRLRYRRLSAQTLKISLDWDDEYNLSTSSISLKGPPAAELNNNWNGIAFGNNLFVSVAASGTGNRVMTSPDGVTWTSRTSAADNVWNSIAFGNGLFVAISSSGTGNRVMTSSDGVAWTSRTSAADNNWQSVTFGNNLFVAVSSGQEVVGVVMTSPDGITWTLRTAIVGRSWQSVTYGNGLYVAVSNDAGAAAIMTSPDGITWTIRTAASFNAWQSVTYGNALFVAVSTSGTGNRVMTSPDGVTWTSRTSAADNAWQSIIYANSLFVAVAISGTGNRVMTSADGLTWVTRTSAADNNWQSVVFGNNIFVAVAQTGTGNRVMTSSDGVAWTTDLLNARVSSMSLDIGGKGPGFYMKTFISSSNQFQIDSVEFD